MELQASWASQTRSNLAANLGISAGADMKSVITVYPGVLFYYKKNFKAWEERKVVRALHPQDDVGVLARM